MVHFLTKSRVFFARSDTKGRAIEGMFCEAVVLGVNEDAMMKEAGQR